jgi:hypothetical protein
MIRYAYPGIGPWEWADHPEWLGRVQCTLLAEIEGAQIRQQHEQGKD